ncbi:hypothetical protein GGF32_006014, partial [Allomyces javanicus]
MADTTPAPPGAPAAAAGGASPGSAPPAAAGAVPPTSAGASTNGGTALPTAANLEKAAEAGQRVYENTYRVGPDRTFPTAHAR